jgi:predicted DNA-binding transcriptional regulator AlpA
MNTGSEADPFVTTEQVAIYLAKPVSFIYGNAERLGIPRRKIGQCYRYKLSEIDSWLVAQSSASR